MMTRCRRSTVRLVRITHSWVTIQTVTLPLNFTQCSKRLRGRMMCAITISVDVNVRCSQRRAAVMSTTVAASDIYPRSDMVAREHGQL